MRSASQKILKRNQRHSDYNLYGFPNPVKLILKYYISSIKYILLFFRAIHFLETECRWRVPLSDDGTTD